MCVGGGRGSIHPRAARQQQWQVACRKLLLTLTLVIHGIHCGMRSRSSHSAKASSSGTSHSAWALQPRE